MNPAASIFDLKEVAIKEIGEDQCEEIIQDIKLRFGRDIGLRLFSSTVEPRLRQAIFAASGEELHPKIVKKLAYSYFDKSFYKEEKFKKEIWPVIALAFQAAYVKLLMTDLNENHQHLLWKSVEELKDNFETIAACADESELELLLKFRNAVKMASLVIPDTRNRDRLWNIGCRLSDPLGHVFVRGTGQRKEVSWRLEIFSIAGGGLPRSKISHKRKHGNEDNRDDGAGDTTADNTSFDCGAVSADNDVVDDSTSSSPTRGMQVLSAAVCASDSRAPSSHNPTADAVPSSCVQSRIIPSLEE